MSSLAYEFEYFGKDGEGNKEAITEMETSDV